MSLDNSSFGDLVRKQRLRDIFGDPMSHSYHRQRNSKSVGSWNYDIVLSGTRQM